MKKVNKLIPQKKNWRFIRKLIFYN